STAFQGTELFAVESVATTNCTLRRIGLAANEGMPPAQFSGAVSGVTFAVLTLKPQIVRASFDVNTKIGIDDALVGRRSADLQDPEQVRDACTLLVLWRAYQEAARNAGDNSDHFAAQSKAFKEAYDERMAMTAVDWFWTVGQAESTQAPFGMRVVR